jgi:hypothetical protein
MTPREVTRRLVEEMHGEFMDVDCPLTRRDIGRLCILLGSIITEVKIEIGAAEESQEEDHA